MVDLISNLRWQSRGESTIPLTNMLFLCTISCEMSIFIDHDLLVLKLSILNLSIVLNLLCARRRTSYAREMSVYAIQNEAPTEYNIKRVYRPRFLPTPGIPPEARTLKTSKTSSVDASRQQGNRPMAFGPLGRRALPL
ncbi:hypothetical protein F4809DRAFT_52326 [Biscogniauxia mediterranea]|nr:hypothetical protein F4809DRAFT_52326 [Biscogniauxia mediterranea]